MGDVLASVSPATTGPALRAALEARCQKEPTKTQVADQLAEAFRQGKIVVTDVTPAAGVKALGVKEIRERSLDAFHVLTKVEADKTRRRVRRSSSRRRSASSRRPARPVSPSAKFRDELADKDKPLVEMRMTVRAEPGSGLQDLDLLSMALAQMPKQHIGVAWLSTSLHRSPVSTASIEVRLAGRQGQVPAGQRQAGAPA